MGEGDSNVLSHNIWALTLFGQLNLTKIGLSSNWQAGLMNLSLAVLFNLLRTARTFDSLHSIS